MHIFAFLGLALVMALPVTPLGATPTTTPAPAPTSQPDMAAFARGAKAWADNCGRCHAMHDPKHLSDPHWKVVTTHMRLRAGLDGTQMRDITAFLQGSNDMNGSSLPAAPLLLAGTSRTAVVAEGKALYVSTCIACHGPNAQCAIPGVPNLATGTSLAKPDAELTANILNGFQSKGSPMAMPPKGGNPNLTVADAETLVVYIRMLIAPSN